jgi:hypothetical protein
LVDRIPTTRCWRACFNSQTWLPGRLDVVLLSQVCRRRRKSPMADLYRLKASSGSTSVHDSIRAFESDGLVVGGIPSAVEVLGSAPSDPSSCFCVRSVAICERKPGWLKHCFATTRGSRTVLAVRYWQKRWRPFAMSGPRLWIMLWGHHCALISSPVTVLRKGNRAS